MDKIIDELCEGLDAKQIDFARNVFSEIMKNLEPNSLIYYLPVARRIIEYNTGIRKTTLLFSLKFNTFRYFGKTYSGREDIAETLVRIAKSIATSPIMVLE